MCLSIPKTLYLVFFACSLNLLIHTNMKATDFSAAFLCLVTKFINGLYRLYFLLLDDVDVDVLGDFGVRVTEEF